MGSSNHFTTRRGFVTAMGFGGVSLYGLWAAYGLAPGPLALLGIHGEHDQGGTGGGHGETPTGPGVDEFRSLAEAFTRRFRLPDGSVYPRSLPGGGVDAARPATTAGHATHDTHGVAAVVAGAGAVAHPSAATADHAAHAAGEDGGEVYLLAGKWFYEPAVLRLDAGRTYRLRMMAVDVAHGASIQFGRGGRMVRLRPGRVTELSLAFHRSGDFLVHCTVYCGLAHDYMRARIVVA